MNTLHSNLMVEPWKGDRKLKAKVSNGFASISQKSNIVKLKVLVDAHINYAGNTMIISKGSHVLVSEELLFTNKQALKTVTIEEGATEYMLLDFNYIIGIE